MKTVDILLVGTGGYGAVYLGFFRDGIFDGKTVRLAGVADPYAAQSACYDWILENHIPIYETPAAFFQERRADLTIVSTPTTLHRAVSMIAMENGSQVLCEKPLVPTIQELDALELDREKLGKQLAVGFQWSYSDTMSRLKRDVLAGLYGRPKMLKTFVSWPRRWEYYRSSTWKGRVRDANGAPILDSIVTNATAHYLHNIFFLLGDTMQTAAYPEDLAVELYRAKEIESFDTCFLKGRIGGGEFFYAASHATDRNENPEFVYEFEKGRVTFHEDSSAQNGVIGTLADGRTINYGDPFTQLETARKCQAMVDYIRTGEPLNCTIPTVRPHLLTCNAIFDFGRVQNFPKEQLVEVAPDRPEDANVYCKGLYEDMRACYADTQLPSEKELTWSAAPVKITLDGYDHFQGGGF